MDPDSEMPRKDLNSLVCVWYPLLEVVVEMRARKTLQLPKEPRCWRGKKVEVVFPLEGKVPGRVT